MKHNGMTVKLRTDAKGGIETTYFATGRRCPEVKAAVDAVCKARTAVQAASRRLDLVAGHMAVADTVKAVDAAAVQQDEAQQALLDAQAAFIDAQEAFVVAGYVGAGYPLKEAQRLFDCVASAEDAGDIVNNLIGLAQVGMGSLDFTKRQEGMPDGA